MGLVHEEVALFVVGVVVEVYWWTLCDEYPPFLDPLCFSNGTQVGLQKNSKNFSSSSLNEFFVDKMGILFDIAGNKIFLKGNGKYKNKKKKSLFFFSYCFFIVLSHSKAQPSVIIVMNKSTTLINACFDYKDLWLLFGLVEATVMVTYLHYNLPFSK